MKNAAIAVLTLTLIVVGYYAATTLRMPNPAAEGKTATLMRGDLTLPINATGEVKPALRVEVKSKASGEVIEITKHPGDRVQVGDLLIRLLPVDEQRSVDRANQDLQIGKARLDIAKIKLELAKGAELANAQAQVDQLVPSVTYAEFRKKKIEQLDPEQTNQEEVLQRDSDYRRFVAQLDAAKANLEKVKLAVPLAEHAVTEAAAAYEAAKSNLADAKKRLSETRIVSPIAGIVADIRTQIGAVIQGGKTTFTGGTVLAVVLDMDRLVVRAEVDEADIGRVLAIAPEWASPGHDASIQMPTDLSEAVAAVEHPPTITVESFRDEEFSGVIERIYPEPTNVSNVVTYLVDVVVTSGNRDLLLSGMRADVRFTSQHVTDVVLCPNEAIHEGPLGKLGVYIPKPGTPADQRETEFVPVRFGLDNGNYSEVREGLAEGATVYTKRPVKRDRESDRKRR